MKLATPGSCFSWAHVSFFPEICGEPKASLNEFMATISVALPLSVRGYLGAVVLSFAHTLGEFGVVLMVGGNIPGETRVISIAIYDQVESLNYTAAHQLSATLLVFAFIALFVMFLINRRWQQR